jgi:hypothetical protein
MVENRVDKPSKMQRDDKLGQIAITSSFYQTSFRDRLKKTMDTNLKKTSSTDNQKTHTIKVQISYDF